MSKIELGTVVGNESKFSLDLQVLMRSRMIIQANSGGGKSYLCRKLLEETFGKVQQIILDPEDDFASLREKFNYVLVGKGGDLAAEIRYAEVLARRLLETHTSAIINLYELNKDDRREFVRQFLEAMVDSPKELWHHCLVMLDEMHDFAPESTKSDSKPAVIDMAARGRKRGFCLVGATQRISKLDKDVVAECQNKLMGLANMDIDRKRSAEELGFADKAQILTMRDLYPGEFFAVGPAFDRGVTKVRIGKVQTTHHEAGTVFKRKYKPSPSAAIQKILTAIKDIPAEIEEEQATRKSQLEKIRELERELREARKNTKVETKLTTDPKAVNKAVEKFKKELLKTIEKANKQFVSETTKAFKDMEPFTYTPPPKQIEKRLPPIPPPKRVEVDGDGPALGKGERAILKFLAISPGRSFTKQQVGALTGYAYQSGSFATYLSRLSSQGLIVKSGDSLMVSQVAMSTVQNILGGDFIEPSPDALVAWLDKLGKGERAIFSVIKDQPDRDFSKEELCAETGYEDSGSFATYLSRLNALGLIRKNHDKTISLNRELLEV